MAPYLPSGSQTYNGVISGPGGFIQRGNGTTILNNNLNTYSGGTTPTAGPIAFGVDSVGTTPDSGPIGTGPLLLAPEVPSLSGSGLVIAYGGARTIANPIQYPSATNNLTLIVGGTNALTFTGPIALQGQDSTGTTNVRIFQVTNTALTTFSGVISDGGAVIGLTKTGGGILVLDQSITETYTGPTTVSAGTLQVNGQLDAASAVMVNSNAMLAGTGTINGTVTVNTNGAIAPGTSAIGSININNNLTFAGGNMIAKVNRSGFSSDQAIVSGMLTNIGDGVITVTNLGLTLQAGDAFTLFSKPVSNGVALHVTGAGVIWTNKLAIDGSIAAASFVATTPTNISIAASGNTLTLSWPPNYLGWSLQSNSVSLSSATNWFTVPNSLINTQYVITVNPARTNVFYRLAY
jgi:autotransporter-associated beta strand protein